MALDSRQMRSRSCGHSCQGHQDCGEPSEPEKVFGLLFVAGCDPAKSFDGSKEPFDHVAMLVSFSVVAFFPLSCRIGADAGFAACFTDGLSDRVAVVGRVGDNIVSAEPREQFFSLGSVTGLARRNDDPYRSALSVHCSMQFGCQPSTRTPETTPLVSFLFFSVGFRCDPLAD